MSTFARKAAEYGLRPAGAGAFIRVPRRLHRVGWDRLLKGWLELVRRMEEPDDESERLSDAGWWYGERTLTGLLAGRLAAYGSLVVCLGGVHERAHRAPRGYRSKAPSEQR